MLSNTSVQYHTTEDLQAHSTKNWTKANLPKLGQIAHLTQNFFHPFKPYLAEMLAGMGWLGSAWESPCPSW